MSKDKELRIEKVGKSNEIDYELQSILAATEMPKAPTLSFDDNGNIELIDELNTLIPQSIDSPEEKYELFYKVIEKFLRKLLPSGNAYKKARAMVREEIKTFLTRGHRAQNGKPRGADSRMAYQEDMKQIAQILIECLANNSSTFELFTRVSDLNKKMGY
ncbi:MAG: hypothetical protein DBY35_12515 [Bacteroidales bacterium]|uniref:hypothetical protein n=1 Tax=Bacteroides acidifaciens TaxID=85831 RepID=UPI000D78EC62|nr:hypothetical protein [Bacteroides acidifaciens]PWL58637.1 MAG: hypothetical protein DBY35_12515 [Bacteroidales bacterium]